MLDLTKPVQTRSGLKATLLHTGLRGGYPIAAAVTLAYGEIDLWRFEKGGNIYFGSRTEHPEDLINVPPILVEKWVNVYSFDGVNPIIADYDSEETAARGAAACGRSPLGRLKLVFSNGYLICSTMIPLHANH